MYLIKAREVRYNGSWFCLESDKIGYSFWIDFSEFAFAIWLTSNHPDFAEPRTRNLVRTFKKGVSGLPSLGALSAAARRARRYSCR